MKIFDDLAADVFGPTLKFLKSDCCPALLTDVGHHTAAAKEVAPRIQEVGTFIKILSVLLDRLFLRVWEKTEDHGPWGSVFKAA